MTIPPGMHVHMGKSKHLQMRTRGGGWSGEVNALCGRSPRRVEAGLTGRGSPALTSVVRCAGAGALRFGAYPVRRSSSRCRRGHSRQRRLRRLGDRWRGGLARKRDARLSADLGACGGISRPLVSMSELGAHLAGRYISANAPPSDMRCVRRWRPAWAVRTGYPRERCGAHEYVRPHTRCSRSR